ncbi:hypothetical protein LMG29739_01710 [Paraburkholderia solisilvae]|uniref:Uncharacterized protein n=1 Tax=Paraburkholderia solisilvae TaxID=624376 RepID=A0A6J5DKF4_9BURK|nr:hypothetical protein LMG29739_01710 [Paraburkholderia solisilvae]
MHIACALSSNVAGVTIAIAFLTPLIVRARSLLPLAPAPARTRTVHPSRCATRATRHPNAYD